jgi:hypothetical protein
MGNLGPALGTPRATQPLLSAIEYAEFVTSERLFRRRT